MTSIEKIKIKKLITGTYRAAGPNIFIRLAIQYINKLCIRYIPSVKFEITDIFCLNIKVNDNFSHKCLQKINRAVVSIVLRPDKYANGVLGFTLITVSNVFVTLLVFKII